MNDKFEISNPINRVTWLLLAVVPLAAIRLVVVVGIGLICLTVGAFFSIKMVWKSLGLIFYVAPVSQYRMVKDFIVHGRIINN